MLEFGVFHHILHGVHDFGDAGFIVGPEEGGAVGGDEGLALVLTHLGELFRLELQAGDALEVDGSAVVVFNDLGLDIGPGGVRRGIHVGDETHGGDFVVQVGGDGGHHVAVFVQADLHAEGRELVPEHLQKVPLAGGRGLALRLLVRLGVHADVS